MKRFALLVVFFGLTCSCFAFASGDGQARAYNRAPEAAYKDVLNEPATEVALDRAIATLSAAGCNDIACLSMQDISQAVSLLDRRDLPGGNTLRDPTAFNPAVYDRQIDQLLTIHGERNPYRCAILIKIARHSASQPRWTAATDPGLWLRAIDIASRIQVSGSECLTGFLKALPHTQTARVLVGRAREYCSGFPASRCAHLLPQS